jgi:hypothetical protein
MVMPTTFLRALVLLWDARDELSNNLCENAMRTFALGRNYEQSGIRQSLARGKPDFRRWALDFADGATAPVFA